MSPLWITAILTTHQRPSLMLRALASLGAETRRPDEILVVEDGDDPATAGLLRASGIRCRLLQRPMGSVAKARNLGLEEARGDWVIYLDDDDIAYPDRCRVLAAAALRSGCGLVFGSTLKVSATVQYGVPTHHPLQEGHGTFLDFLRCMPHTNSILFRKADLVGVGGFVESSSYFSDLCALLHLLDRLPEESGAFRVPHPHLAEFEAAADGMTFTVARGRTMKVKVLEAFDSLRLEREPNRRAVRRVREAVERAEPFQDYDSYVAIAAECLASLDPVPRPRPGVARARARAQVG